MSPDASLLKFPRFRFQESERRPKAFADLSKAIQKVMMFVDLHSKGDEKYAHLTAEEAAKAGAAAVETQAWMEKNMNEQVMTFTSIGTLMLRFCP